MKTLLRWMISFALLAAFPVMAATNATSITAPLAGVTCVGSNCTGVPNDATHAWFFAPATGATFAVTGTFWQTTQPVSGTFWQTTQPVSVSGTVITAPVSTATQTTNIITTVAVSSSSVTLTAANSSRKSLVIMNIGANSCTVTTANPAVSGSGTVYASGGPFPSQGGSNQYDSKVPVNAYYAICPAGLSTTFSVEEGN